MVVEAVEVMRKMRGGAQAWLIRASDDRYYVVKFKENAQHPRILINEWITSHFLSHLQICAGHAALMRCSADWLRKAENQDLSIQIGKTVRRPSAGFHYGSRVPVNPMTSALYDYLPDALMESLENRSHFHGMLVFDQWVSNADTPQAIYFRGKPNEFLQDRLSAPGKLGMLAMMIDHGYAFQGPEWELRDSPRHGVYPRPAPYAGITGWQSLDPWLTRVRCFPETVVDEACKSMPSSWFGEGEEAQLERLLLRLLQRAKRIPDLVDACRKARPELFPLWTSIQG